MKRVGEHSAWCANEHTPGGRMCQPGFNKFISDNSTRDFPDVPGVKASHSNEGNLLPGCGAKILHAT